MHKNYIHYSQIYMHLNNMVAYHMLTQDIFNFANVIKSHISQGRNNLIIITWGRGGNNVCRNTSKWRVDIWNEMKYLVFHNNINIFLLLLKFCFPWNSRFFVRSVFAINIFVYFRCLLLSLISEKTWKMLVMQ